MPCTVRVPSTLRKIALLVRGSRRILLDALAGRLGPRVRELDLGPSSSPPTSISAGSTTGRKTMSIDGIFFSMMGHSSTIRIPSMRMKSALMGAKLSRS